MQLDTLSELSILIHILVLSIFIGFEIISKVPTMLHTPLMSGSNAISGIIIIGAIIILPLQESTLAHILSYAAILFATINLVGGFVVTDRMLAMFKQKNKE